MEIDMEVNIDGDDRRPALVLVHSLLTDWRAFDPVIPVLAERRRVIRVSLPGFGATPSLGNPDPTIFDLADAVAGAMSAVGAGPNAAVLGNGLGAFVVAALAVTNGRRFGPLISANGGAAFPEDRWAAFTTMSTLVDDGGMEAVVDVAVRRIFTDAHLARHPHLIEERRAVLVRTDPGAFSASCRALRDLDLRDRVGDITNPTLVIAGGADQTTPPNMARELAAGIPGSESVELAGCGHCPPLERPDDFAAAVDRFLRAHE